MSCSLRAGTSISLAQARLHAQCWKGTQVLPRYGFLKVNTLKLAEDWGCELEQFEQS